MEGRQISHYRFSEADKGFARQLVEVIYDLRVLRPMAKIRTRHLPFPLVSSPQKASLQVRRCWPLAWRALWSMPLPVIHVSYDAVGRVSPPKTYRLLEPL